MPKIKGFKMDKKVYEYTEIIERDIAENNLTNEEREELAAKIKPMLCDDSIVLAQVNPTSGDIKKNALKAKKWIEWANMLEVKAIVFPETFLLGAPIGDYIIKFPQIVEEAKEWLDVLAKIAAKTKVIIGFVEFNSSDKSGKYYNSVAVLSDGKIEKIIRKSVLSDYAELNESRYFVRAVQDDETRVVELGNKKAGILIGEGECVSSDFGGEGVNFVGKHKKNIQPDFILACVASVSRTGKESQKHSMLSYISKKYSTPIIFVNQAGASDCLSYNGESCVYNALGELIYRAKSFEEQFFIVNPFDGEGTIYSGAGGSDRIMNSENSFTLDYEPDLERTYKTIIQSVRDYYNKNGFKRACLGLSGGLDSTVCAVIMADAIGKENVFGISMPSKITSAESKSDAKKLAENLGINFIEVPIKSMFDAARDNFNNMFSQIEAKWDCRYKQSYTNDNIQARTRATILWGISNEFEDCLCIATSDKSEAYMGYATINGDMSGGFAPIADVTKTKLFALARWMNEHREIKNAIPNSIISKRPGAELAINPKTGKPLLAEEALMPYEFMDEVIWRVENTHQSIDDMAKSEFLYERLEHITKEQKLEWLEKFFKRMTSAGYKWSIMPPAPIVDTVSINKTEYHQSILSSGISYRKTSMQEKMELAAIK